MSLTTRDIGGRRFRDIFDPLEDLFRTPFTSIFPSQLIGSGVTPTSRMDILERRDHYEVTAELPGVRKEDVHVNLDGNRLFLQAEKREEQREESERMYFSERTYGSIRRTVEMPGGVDPNKVKAQFENGVLKVWIGKRETAEGQIVPIQ
jgi:HSP20 family protein